jgi:hypothetical protein
LARKTKLHKPPKEGAAILVYDIETAPILSYHWRLYDENISLDQIEADWFVLSWSAKWLRDPPSKVMYQDQSTAKKLNDDKGILEDLHTLIDQADVVITQNGIKFDQKKLNARFVINGMKPPSTVKHVDTCAIAKKVFGFTSNKLEYMTEKLCKKYKKLKHKKFPGFSLWKECLKGNKAAWAEMKKYNVHDVLALEELYLILMPYDNSVNYDLYSSREEYQCQCGSEEFKRNGYYYTPTATVIRWRCTNCGAEHRENAKGQKRNIPRGSGR